MRTKQKQTPAEQSWGRLGLNLPPPPTPMRAPSGIVVKSVESLDRFIQHPGFGLTPQKVVQCYRQAECGWPERQVDLFEDIIENDGHLRSVIEARTLAVAGKPWSVMPGGNEPIDIAAAQILNDALEETNFGEAIGAVLGARYYGYSATEIRWEDVGGDVVPTWFVPIPFRRIRFDDQDQPRIVNGMNGFETEALEPGKWIYARNTGPLTSVTARSGLMRTATWFALWKRWSWRDWVIYAEKFGIPLVIGRYQADSGSTDADKAALEDIVSDIGEAGSAVMSDKTEVEIREAQRGGDSNGLHINIVKESNNEISKLITGSTLTVESGGPGSFALGKVHESRAFDLVVSDADLVAKRFAMDLARPFLRFNGLEGARVPRLNIAVTREVDPLTRAQIVEKLHGMGLPLDTEQLRNEFQIKAPPSDERALQPPDQCDQGMGLPFSDRDDPA